MTLHSPACILFCQGTKFVWTACRTQHAAPPDPTKPWWALEISSNWTFFDCKAGLRSILKGAAHLQVSLVSGWIYYFVVGGFDGVSGEYMLNISLLDSPHSGPYQTLPLPGRYAHANISLASEVGASIKCTSCITHGCSSCLLDCESSWLPDQYIPGCSSEQGPT